MEPVRFIALIIGQLNAAGGEGRSDLLIPEQGISDFPPLSTTGLRHSAEPHNVYPLLSLIVDLTGARSPAWILDPTLRHVP
jgi:hypothetical protein